MPILTGPNSQPSSIYPKFRSISLCRFKSRCSRKNLKFSVQDIDIDIFSYLLQEVISLEISNTYQ